MSRSGSVVEVVDLLPGQDPLTVGSRGLEHPRVGAGRDQHHVGVEALLPGLGRRDDGGRSVQPTAPWTTVTPSLRAGGRCPRLRRRQLLDPGVDRAEVDGRPRCRDRTSSAPNRTPSSPDSCTDVITSAVAIRVLDGTQSVSTAEPPRPSLSTTVTSAPSWAPDQRRLVAARAAADDHDSGHAGHDTLPPVPLYAAYGSNLDPARMAQRCPHSPLRGTGWLMGWRLTFGGEEHGWDGALATIVEDPASQVFVTLYDVTARGRGRARRLGDTALPQAPAACRRPSTARSSPGCTCSTPTRAGCPRPATSG